MGFEEKVEKVKDEKKISEDAYYIVKAILMLVKVMGGRWRQ